MTLPLSSNCIEWFLAAPVVTALAQATNVSFKSPKQSVCFDLSPLPLSVINIESRVTLSNH